MGKNQNKILSKIDTLIDSNYKVPEESKAVLEEINKGVNMKINILCDIEYLSYKFDKTIKKNKNSKESSLLFPFFSKIKKAHSMCDYIIFCQKDKKLYILLIELKKSDDKVTNQLDAGEDFAKFIIKTLNRVYKKGIKNTENIKTPIIRKIPIREYNIAQANKKTLARGKKKPVEIENGLCKFNAKNFILEDYL